MVSMMIMAVMVMSLVLVMVMLMMMIAMVMVRMIMSIAGFGRSVIGVTSELGLVWQRLMRCPRVNIEFYPGDPTTRLTLKMQVAILQVQF